MLLRRLQTLLVGASLAAAENLLETARAWLLSESGVKMGSGGN